MATQTVEFPASTGRTLTAKLFALGSDTQTASVAATEATNRKGVYAAAFTDVAAAVYKLVVLDGSSIPAFVGYVTLTLTTATFEARGDPSGVAEIQSGLSTLTLAQLSNVRAVTILGPVVRQGLIELVQGDDYLTADGTELTFSNAAGSWALNATDVITLYFSRTIDGAETEIECSGTVVDHDGPPQVITVDVPRAKSDLLLAGEWNYQLKAVDTQGHVKTLEWGDCTAIGDLD